MTQMHSVSHLRGFFRKKSEKKCIFFNAQVVDYQRLSSRAEKKCHLGPFCYLLLSFMAV